MLSAISSPLVAGSAAPPMATKHIQVIRPFYMKGVVQSVGKVLEVDARFAVELVQSNKAILVDAPKPEEVKAEDAPAPAAQPRRSRKDVG
jgi:hypothetical protein